VERKDKEEIRWQMYHVNLGIKPGSAGKDTYGQGDREVGVCNRSLRWGWAERKMRRVKILGEKNRMTDDGTS